MAEANETSVIVYRNLIDAGCNEATTNQCMLLLQAGKKSDMLPILSKHRAALLNSVHKGQKQIDCLDYLIYRIRREENIQ